MVFGTIGIGSMGPKDLGTLDSCDYGTIGLWNDGTLGPVVLKTMGLLDHVSL